MTVALGRMAPATHATTICAVRTRGRMWGRGAKVAVAVVATAALFMHPAAGLPDETIDSAGSILLMSFWEDPVEQWLFDPDTGQEAARVTVEALDPEGTGYPQAVWLDSQTVRVHASSHDVVDLDVATGTRRAVGDAFPSPLLSPDGTRAVNSFFGTGVNVYDYETGTEREIIPPEAEPRGHHSWAADSRSIVEIVKGEGRWDLVRVDVETGAMTVIEVGDLNPRRPKLSPAGDRVLFAAVEAHPTDSSSLLYTGLWLVNTDGSDLTKVYEPTQDVNVYPGEWRPDGMAFTFTQAAREGGPTPSSSFLVKDLADGTTWTWAPPEGDGAASWSPDGRWLASGRWVNDSGCHCIIPTGVDLVRPFGDDPATEVTDAYFLGWAPGVTRRFDGVDRIDTAVRISEYVWDQADTAVIARANLFPDALAGGPLAVTVEGPLLLNPTAALDDRVAAELRRLGTSTVHLLGSEVALSAQVADDLTAMGITVHRAAGEDRFHTATLVADRMPAPLKVFLAEGQHPDPNRGWPDAVSGSGLAATAGWPLLLSRQHTLPEATRAWLADHRDAIGEVIAIGGTAAISSGVLADAGEAAGATTGRLGGANRYETSFRAASYGVDQLGADPDIGWLAIGTNWPDALVAGAAAGSTRGFLHLVPPDAIDPADAVWPLVEDLPNSARIHLAGGRDVLHPAIEMTINRNARAGR